MCIVLDLTKLYSRTAKTTLLYTFLGCRFEIAECFVRMRHNKEPVCKAQGLASSCQICAISILFISRRTRIYPGNQWTQENQDISRELVDPGEPGDVKNRTNSHKLSTPNQWARSCQLSISIQTPVCKLSIPNQ